MIGPEVTFRSPLLPAAPDAIAGFVVGAVYDRQADIHDRFGGQRQYGISTPQGQPYIFLFSGATGSRHGYFDYYDEDGVFHYFGEGQKGDMRMERGNLAIRNHLRTGRRLLVFKSLGGGRQRFVGEFVYEDHDVIPDHPDSDGRLRNAIVFRLRPVHDHPGADPELQLPALLGAESVGATERQAIVKLRVKQQLFRRRLSVLERACRLTGIDDLRFLRASHIKPWRDASDDERIDPHNGLLLTPSADLLFDKGWISFRSDGRLIVSERLPGQVREKLGVDVRDGRKCGTFTPRQTEFLEYHRDCVYGRTELQEGLIQVLFD
jgi:5-methylcytosine-specific restriction protein A